MTTKTDNYQKDRQTSIVPSEMFLAALCNGSIKPMDTRSPILKRGIIGVLLASHHRRFDER